MRHVQSIMEKAHLKKGDRRVEDVIPPKARWFDYDFLETWWDEVKEGH